MCTVKISIRNKFVFYFYFKSDNLDLECFFKSERFRLLLLLQIRKYTDDVEI